MVENFNDTRVSLRKRYTNEGGFKQAPIEYIEHNIRKQKTSIATNIPQIYIERLLITKKESNNNKKYQVERL